MFYTYVMGIDNSIFDLKHEKFNIEIEGSNYKVSFPDEKAPVWEEFIKKHLEIGYWNEYLANDKVVFLFHLETGFKKFEVIDYKSDEVLRLCEKLCESKFDSLKSMLVENSYYKTIINR